MIICKYKRSAGMHIPADLFRVSVHNGHIRRISQIQAYNLEYLKASQKTLEVNLPCYDFLR